MIAGVQPDAVRVGTPRPAAPAANGNALPSPGGDRPVMAPAVVALPDRSRSVEVLDRYLADSQRSLQFLHDPSVGQTIIVVVDPGSGEILRQIPAREWLVLAQQSAQSRPSLIDLRA